MSLKSHQKRGQTAAVAGVFLLSACVTNPDGTTRFDDRATGALIGAAAGCALARITGKDCAAGAALGAVAGLLVGWHFESKKVAGAQRVNAEYKAKGTAIPKKAIVPVAFKSRVKQGAPAADGTKEVQVTSNSDLIGYGDKAPVVQEKYALYDENDKLLDEKTETVAAVDGAGRYETTSKFTLPADSAGKDYTIRTVQIVDGKPGPANTYKVSSAGDLDLIVALQHPM